MVVQSRDALANPWFGVSLGGWLLLEPGPSYPLFAHHPKPDGEQARCEWDLMKAIKPRSKALEVMKMHRDTHITKADFERIKACGLNAVRLPFGYWVVTKARPNEPYVGPALEYIDRAVDWAEECGLQIVLDLHGCPGSESPEAPCGRRQRPESRWHWRHWDFKKSLEILEFLAKRYGNRTCVTGIAVCNEPCGKVPASTLMSYYSKAVDRIRQSGMPASRVAVVLPLFQRPEGEDGFVKLWTSKTQGRHRNICFDVHAYHCFENIFNGKTFAEQLRAVEENEEMLRQHPMVIGEWSLALGVATWCTAGDLKEDSIYSIFGAQQRKALKAASHGSFFWTWKEMPESREWNFQEAYRSGLLSGAPMQLPSWDGAGEDPLEELLNPSPADARVYYGDTVYLRVFYGRYMDVEGTQADARWPDKGQYQAFTFSPGSDKALSSSTRQPVRHRDVVRIQNRNGRFLAVQGASVTTTRSLKATSADFEVFIDGAGTLLHRGHIYLSSRVTSMCLNADEDADGLAARFRDMGQWQAICVEKSPEEQPCVKLPGPGPGRKAPGTKKRAGNVKLGGNRESRECDEPVATPLAGLLNASATPQLASGANRGRKRKRPA
mmetsp:Transcript_76670/g.135281  ORF Transcript_76670/g.135281 Transcript_76670/m.135281 type:complete len:608 (-) Transcript_76670:86-1909(-)